MHQYVTFSDEACTSGHDFMVIGGIMCSEDCAARMLRQIDIIHPGRPDHWTYEWKYLRKSNMQRYRDFVNLFFEFNKEHLVDFRCAVFDCREFRHKHFNGGDKELGFNKFLRLHLYSHWRALRGSARFNCYHHRRDSRYDLETVRSVMNNHCFKSGGRIVDPYKEVAYTSFADKPMLQFADVLIGAVGFRWNKKTGIKAEIADLIQDYGCHQLSEPTPAPMKHFDIWNVDLAGTS